MRHQVIGILSISFSTPPHAYGSSTSPATTVSTPASPGSRLSIYAAPGHLALPFHVQTKTLCVGSFETVS
jgi:hypothetical protein